MPLLVRGFLSSPRTWGCFRLAGLAYGFHPVFPTHVGVFLFVVSFGSQSFCLPHARGGVSLLSSFFSTIALSSPRTWGCFPTLEGALQVAQVFPTHVGVFLAKSADLSTFGSLPHARGGVSGGGHVRGVLDESSPRTWGCFFGNAATGAPFPVFPTHVGVFPMRPVCY